MEVPEGPFHQKNFDDERATEAALVFWRGAGVGFMVSLAPPEEERGEDEDGEEGAPARPRLFPPLFFSFLCRCFRILYSFFSTDWDGGDQGALLLRQETVG